MTAPNREGWDAIVPRARQSLVAVAEQLKQIVVQLDALADDAEAAHEVLEVVVEELKEAGR